jgi:hypothetical protein
MDRESPSVDLDPEAGVLAAHQRADGTHLAAFAERHVSAQIRGFTQIARESEMSIVGMVSRLDRHGLVQVPPIALERLQAGKAAMIGDLPAHDQPSFFKIV